MDIFDELRDFLNIPPAELAQKRLSICRGCEYFEAHYSRCSKCGCIMPVKVRLPKMKCPVGKW